jgi:hypothetical protein
MIPRHNGLLAPQVSEVPADSPAVRERERLRRELLKRIIFQETRRQAARGPAR